MVQQKRHLFGCRKYPGETLGYKKVKRYYEGLQYIDLNGEDPDVSYNAMVECNIEDLKL